MCLEVINVVLIEPDLSRLKKFAVLRKQTDEKWTRQPTELI